MESTVSETDSLAGFVRQLWEAGQVGVFDVAGKELSPKTLNDAWLQLQLYASDASIYQIRPLGVVRPRTSADVAACAVYATENRIPLHARGAGTGLAGE